MLYPQQGRWTSSTNCFHPGAILKFCISYPIFSLCPQNLLCLSRFRAFVDPLPLLCGRPIWNPPRSAFLTRYHESGVRELVLEQLQGMADGGATIISTRLWLVDMAGTTSEAYRSELLLLGT